MATPLNQILGILKGVFMRFHNDHIHTTPDDMFKKMFEISAEGEPKFFVPFPQILNFLESQPGLKCWIPALNMAKRYIDLKSSTECEHYFEPRFEESQLITDRPEKLKQVKHVKAYLCDICRKCGRVINGGGPSELDN